MARHDPFRNFRFRLEINGLQTAGFSEAAIGATSTGVVEYREGNEPAHVRKLSGLTSYGNVTLKRGMTTSLELVQWHREVIAGGSTGHRKTVTIVVLDETGADAARFVVTEAWPVKFDVGVLNATGNDVLIETIELANEGIERVQ